MADSDRVIALVTTIAADQTLRERLTSASEADRHTILTELGFGDVTPADVAANAHLFAPLVEEIDEEQLASVAGGGRGQDIKDTILVTVAAAAT